MSLTPNEKKQLRAILNALAEISFDALKVAKAANGEHETVETIESEHQLLSRMIENFLDD